MPLAPPVLDVAAGLVDTGQLQGSTAEERDGFGLALAEGARCQVVVCLESLGGVAE